MPVISFRGNLEKMLHRPGDTVGSPDKDDIEFAAAGKRLSATLILLPR